MKKILMITMVLLGLAKGQSRADLVVVAGFGYHQPALVAAQPVLVSHQTVVVPSVPVD